MLETILNNILISIIIVVGVFINYLAVEAVKETKTLNNTQLTVLSFVTVFVTAALDLGAIAIVLALFGVIK